LRPSYDAKAVDQDNDVLSWSLVSGPATSRIDSSLGRFTWHPAAGEFGVNQTARIQVSDPYGAVSHQEITLKASESFVPANLAPRITSTPPTPDNGGETYTYVVRAVDPDGDRILFSFGGAAPAGMSITEVDATSAQITWANPAASASRDFVVQATDARGASHGQRVKLQIGSSTGGGGGVVATPPQFTSEPPLSVLAGQAYAYLVTTNQAPGAGVIFAIEGTAPAGMAIDASTGQLSWATTSGRSSRPSAPQGAAPRPSSASAWP
jgi:hypothetical protein